MRKGSHFIKKLLGNLINQKAHNVQLGHGSFITIDFGNMIETKIHTKKGIKTIKRGEWHLWVYMCAWRIDKNGIPLAGSNDPRDKIETAIKKIENKKLIQFEVMDKSLDAKLSFDGKFELSLFNCSSEGDEHWMLFTPAQRCLTVGPSNKWTYV